MAETTRDIKRRIRGISNTRQITKAMELVSSAKLKRARERLEKSRPYYNTVLSNIQDILATTGNMKHPLLDSREVKTSLYIIVSADRGLAGGYNAGVIRLAEGKIKEENKDAKIITVGTKARDYFKKRDYDVIGEFVGIVEEPTFSDARKIGNMALDLYKDKVVDEIKIVYTKFLGTISQEPGILTLLPSGEVHKESEKRKTVTEFEPSTEEVLDFLIPKYIQSTIYGALIESSSSEQAARRVAMEAATDNAEEMIDELNISYNRARQAAITMEITEIVSGADALK
ncbi:ATP synthase F1 subunit gamma [Tissierella praeacuta]|uniref:ATP synthase gamma chain n=1 Tax=Tissierella praeacuta DSM 18095 TaxID=1123404 RepID=A0A1M4WG71_9FIRM|nr:ATP synthase F1 subunit gamma [Tissierella praeacuta]TCU79053.1 ATP synthase F1 subcomplex gamma subunit [Tissierella praeacuta]SHE80291.1 ATP synthase F1 subcomplex gamma subunit [Tissierella praeacuta DSM 18095]SUO99453.1 Na(+)-translocating ATPase gamma chain [Tissierella praeacuta]